MNQRKKLREWVSRNIALDEWVPGNTEDLSLKGYLFTYGDRVRIRDNGQLGTVCTVRGGKNHRTVNVNTEDGMKAFRPDQLIIIFDEYESGTDVKVLKTGETGRVKYKQYTEKEIPYYMVIVKGQEQLLKHTEIEPVTSAVSESAISDEDVDKMVEVGVETAKEVHGDEYDPKKAKATIMGIIKKGMNKGMTPEDISGWIQSSFRDKE